MANEYTQHPQESDLLILGIDTNEKQTDYTCSVSSAVYEAEGELYRIAETIDSVNSMRSDCDKLDYALAASVGTLCGIMDIFLIAKPGESGIGGITDKWFENRTKDFARIYGWNGEGDISSAINHLENRFNVPYDQTGKGESGRIIYDLWPKNHHFKSLGHNPSTLGLFFSIMDQYENTSHFISGGELIRLEKADDRFVLRGDSVPAKLFCGFINWFCHLISDQSGSHSSKGRGMGIPSPFWAWTNDVIAIKSLLNIPVSEFDKTLNELALDIYLKGYDARFQAAQAVPVIVNDLLTRLVYSLRRLIKYYSVNKGVKTLDELWRNCDPFNNLSVCRMLTISHGSFCLIDIGDALIHGAEKGAGSINLSEFVIRVNLVGIGKFAFAVTNWVKQENELRQMKDEYEYLLKKKKIIDDYLNNLKSLAEMYDDRDLFSFIDDLKSSSGYREAFDKTILLAEKRLVPEEKILRSKADIDAYFTGGK